MVNLNSNITSISPNISGNTAKIGNNGGNSSFNGTIKAVEKYISKAEEDQQSSDMSIKDLLASKNADITSVVSAAAKADMSFKLLVGVRNKLIEAYKQTMEMQL